MTAKDVVISFWNTMKTNNFSQASKWLASDFECIWPQSSERVIGRDNFTAINTYYPAHGQWMFKINSLVAENNTVATDVSISDGVQKARAITFHTVENDLISKQVEFWPENYAAPEWRSQWVKPM